MGSLFFLGERFYVIAFFQRQDNKLNRNLRFFDLLERACVSYIIPQSPVPEPGLVLQLLLAPKPPVTTGS